MASAYEVAQHLVAAFEPKTTTTVERAVAAVLRKLEGLNAAEAAVQAEQRSGSVMVHLQGWDPRELPFEFSQLASNRLVGKQRVRLDEDETARRARFRLGLETTLLDTIIGLGNRSFEFICAAAIHLAGASEARVTGPGDEGGIDFFGRIPLRPADSGINRSAMVTSLVECELLFVGQAKCIGRDAQVERSTLTQFSGDVGSLLNKYEGVRRKPSQRVPDDYYRRNETTLRIFMTTGTFRPGALGFAQSLDIVPINGRQLAQFLIFKGVGIEGDGSEAVVDAHRLLAWAMGGDRQVAP